MFGRAIPGNVSFELWGVDFDCGMHLSEHVQKIAKKAGQRLSLLRRASFYLDPSGRAVVYKSFVRSKLEYAPLA